MNQTDISTPNPTSLTSAPLRNRLRVELNASVPEVWALVGNLERYPEYSAGLAHVAVTTDSKGRCTEYVCHFRPQQEGDAGVAHREVMRWFAPTRGYASMAVEPNAFGLRNCLTMVTLEASGDGTVLTWAEYFDSADVMMQKSVFDEALADIGTRLVERFGGRVAERFLEASH